MKKSEIYYLAALIVCDDKVLNTDNKLEIIERLLLDKQYAELLEKKEAPNEAV